MKNIRCAGYLLAITSLFLCSCVSTKLTSVWKDEIYFGWPERKIIVIGAFNAPGVRRLFEEEIVRQLKLRGTDAVASHNLISSDALPKYEKVESLVKEQGADAVLITHFIGKKKTETVTRRKEIRTPRALAETWQEYYMQGYPEMPGHTGEREYYRLETDMYEVGTDRPIWQVISETCVEGPVPQKYQELVAVMLKKMHQDKMIR